MKHWKKVVLVVGLISSLTATETRVSTMGGDIDLLINDEHNVYLYPSTVMSFGNVATLEFGTLPAWGLGRYPAGLIIKENNIMGIAILGNRPIYTTNHPTNPLNVNANGLIIGMGNKNLSIGVLINTGLKQFSNTPTANTTYSYNAFFLGVAPGITFRKRNMGFDASLNFTIQSWKDKGFTLPTDTLKFAGSPVIDANMRFFMGTKRQKTIAAFHVSYFKDAFEKNGTTTNNGSITSLSAKIGHYMRPQRGVKMISGINLDFSNLSTSDTSGTTTINSGFIIGGEVQVSSRLGFRTGITRTLFAYTKTKNGAASNSTMGFASAPLNVTLGAFLTIRNIRIDASIFQDLLFNGPYFLTGTPSRLAGTISTIINF